MHQMMGHVQMDQRKEIQRIKAERVISYTEVKRQMDIFNCVKTTSVQVVAGTK